eukprot:1151877-Pelagomonas_calceolata.AAC.1
MGIWRVTGSTRLHNLAVRTITVFHSTSNGNKLVSVLNRMGMKFLSRFIRPLMVQSTSSKLVQGMMSIAGPTNTQKDSVESHNFSNNDFAEASCLHSTREVQGVTRGFGAARKTLHVLNFDQVHMPLVYIQLVGLPQAVGSCGPQWSDQYSIRTTGCESGSLRKFSRKKGTEMDNCIQLLRSLRSMLDSEASSEPVYAFIILSPVATALYFTRLFMWTSPSAPGIPPAGHPIYCLP